MKTFQLCSEIWLPQALDQVFRFFSDAYNLDVLTPEWLHFRIVTPRPIAMRKGARIDYQLRLRGLPIRWQSEITAWEPPHLFVDEQRRGPYRKWHHEHRFEERDGKTLAIDEVDYAVLGGSLVNRLIVSRDVANIFAYRHRKLEEIFGASGGPAGRILLDGKPTTS